MRNAIEASAANRSRPRVRSFQSGERAGLEVMDSGSGMSPDILATCCEPFRTTKSAVGAGLGLSMCQGIVRRVRGSLEIESAPGRGTTVRVLLPIAGAGLV
ncbi:MAG: hypothetical protein JNG90_18655 [Planctomycetaceae bacterium]|nr:hypothetical protein [Planctomycetaceae bacterium]